MKEKRITLMRWLNGAAFAALLAVNALANLLPIGGITTGQVSDKFPGLFTPAPVAFAIWGVIYLLLLGFVAFQAGAFNPLRSRVILQRAGFLFVFSCIFNILWLLSWHYLKLGLSVMWIFALLITLIPLSRLIYHSGEGVWERLFTRGAFSLYFGWITVAAMTNVATWLVSLGWNGFGLPQTFWTILLLILGALIGCLTTFRRRDWVYPLAVIWGYAGILIRHLSHKGFQQAYPGVIATTALCVLALCIAAGLAMREDVAV
ncbi:MAG: tryptophan-rich sensory protein [Clostridiales bacterium]|nr:tryptophan-rich sensory protein [Clostridiales bacterium]